MAIALPLVTYYEICIQVAQVLFSPAIARRDHTNAIYFI